LVSAVIVRKDAYSIAASNATQRTVKGVHWSCKYRMTTSRMPDAVNEAERPTPSSSANVRRISLRWCCFKLDFSDILDWPAAALARTPSDQLRGESRIPCSLLSPQKVPNLSCCSINSAIVVRIQAPAV